VARSPIGNKTCDKHSDVIDRNEPLGVVGPFKFFGDCGSEASTGVGGTRKDSEAFFFRNAFVKSGIAGIREF